MRQQASFYSRVQSNDEQVSSHSDHNLVEPQQINAFNDESYFSVFFSPRQLQSPSVAKLICNVLFVILVGIKLKVGGLPWITVFLPTFLSNMISIITIKNELKYVWTTIGNHYAGLCRPVAYVCDTLASLCAKIIILIFLSSIKAEQQINAAASIVTHAWTVSLIPVWILVCISIILRLIPYYPPASSPVYRKKHIIGMFFSTLAYILYRGVQPLLLSLRMDHIIMNRWSIVFVPSWVLIFFGFACSVLMISLAPFANNFTNSDYRVATRTLLYVLALQITSISVASAFFLVLITQKLDFHENAVNGWNHESFRILSPLLALFTTMIVTYPMLYRAALKYQVCYFSRPILLYATQIK